MAHGTHGSEQFRESVEEIAAAAVATVEEMIYNGECQVKFVHAFGCIWKVAIEKVGADEARILSLFFFMMTNFLT